MRLRLLGVERATHLTIAIDGEEIKNMIYLMNVMRVSNISGDT